MTHDPLCMCSHDDIDCSVVCPVGCVCDCKFIAEVRADERKRGQEQYNPCMFCGPNKESTFVCDDCGSEISDGLQISSEEDQK